MTKARDIADFKFENITDTGTEGTKVASGTTAQRGSTAGQIRFNTTTNLAEYYNGTEFKAIDIAPLISSVNNSNPTETEVLAGFDLVITGTNFTSGSTVKFVGTDGTEYTSPTVTVNSDTQITSRINTNIDITKEPFDVKISSLSGLTSIKEDAFNINAKPVWSTASGSLGTIASNDTGNHFTVVATDTEGDTIAYTETGGSVLSGQNLTLNSSTGVISGDPTDVGSDTTISFTLRATSGSNYTDRNFSILITPPSNYFGDGSDGALDTTP
tara:strand:+ start:863 stop:1675 length:813 start_codon:yes stop_codon:yes gene_type:complete